MKLLPAQPPQFCNISWVSEKARNEWSSLIQEISNLTSKLEILSVVENQRACSWQTIAEEKLVFYSKEWAKNGLVSLPLKRVGNFKGFAHRHTPADDKLGAVCVVISKKLSLAYEFSDALDKGDNITQGELLGFPKCDCEFFEENWKNGFIDPMWQSALNTSNTKSNDFVANVCSANPLSNSMLRYIGVRIGFHIPHSMDCSESIRINEDRFNLGKSVNPDVMKAAILMLSMPMSWECLHGVAVVRTPIFYIRSGSMMTVDKYTINVDGNIIPESGEAGLIFPFTEVEKARGGTT